MKNIQLENKLRLLVRQIIKEEDETLKSVAERFPEINKESEIIAKKIINILNIEPNTNLKDIYKYINTTINSKAKTIKADTPHKAQGMLEELIRILSEKWKKQTPLQKKLLTTLENAV